MRGVGGKRNGGGSTLNGSALRIGLGPVTGVIAGATGIGDRGSLWSVTEVLIKFSKAEAFYKISLMFLNVVPVSINFEFFSETGGIEKNLFISADSGEESKFNSVSQKKILDAGFTGSRTVTVSSEVIKADFFPEYFTTIPVLFELQWVLLQKFQYQFSEKTLRFQFVGIFSGFNCRLKIKKQKM